MSFSSSASGPTDRLIALPTDIASFSSDEDLHAMLQQPLLKKEKEEEKVIDEPQQEPTETPSLLKENILYVLKKLLTVLIVQFRMRTLSITGAKIYPQAGAVIGEASGPAHSIANCIPGTLKQILVKDYKGNISNLNSDHRRKVYALHRFTMIASASLTIPAALLVLFMPEIYNTLGNRALDKVGIDCRILAFPPFATAIIASNAAFTDMLTDRRKTFHPLLSAIFQETPMIITAIAGWKTGSFMTIALGQLIFSLTGAVATSANVWLGLKELKCVDELSLSWEEKKEYLKLMLKGLPAAIGDALVREVLIFMLGHKEDPEAPILFYFMLYQIFFTTYAFVKPISNSLSYGGNLQEYKAHTDINERGVMACSTSISVLFGLAVLASKNYLIPFLNEPTDPDAIKANQMMSDWYPLLVLGICLQGPALTQMDKMANVLQKRLLAGALDNLPQLLLLGASFFLSAEHMVVGLLASWVFGDICSIVFGCRLPSSLNPALLNFTVDEFKDLKDLITSTMASDRAQMKILGEIPKKIIGPSKDGISDSAASNSTNEEYYKEIAFSPAEIKSLGDFLTKNDREDLNAKLQLSLSAEGQTPSQPQSKPQSRPQSRPQTILFFDPEADPGREGKEVDRYPSLELTDLSDRSGRSGRSHHQGVVQLKPSELDGSLSLDNAIP
jgi:hypothetical protein